MQSTYDNIKYYNFGQKEKARIIVKLKAFLAQEERIELAILFGSVIRRSFGRDVDIAIQSSPSLSFKELLNMNAQMELELGIPIDLVELSSVPVSFKENILKYGTLIKGKKKTNSQKSLYQS